MEHIIHIRSTRIEQKRFWNARARERETAVKYIKYIRSAALTFFSLLLSNSFVHNFTNLSLTHILHDPQEKDSAMEMWQAAVQQIERLEAHLSTTHVNPRLSMLENQVRTYMN